MDSTRTQLDDADEIVTCQETGGVIESTIENRNFGAENVRAFIMA